MVPDWCHILLDEPQLDYLFEVEMPPEPYYQAFRRWLGASHPEADPFLLDHLESLEVLADVSIVSGFSFGAEKAVLAQPEVQYLGEVVGRERRFALDHHKKAIQEFPEPIRDIPHLRKFLGVVNWVRPHLPAEFA